jgi:hypothetical protein
MKRHKTTYFIESDTCDSCYQLLIIHPKPKQKSLMRRVMWKAWWYNFVEGYHKKCIDNENNI